MILSFLVGLSLPASAASGLFLKTPPATNVFLLKFSGDTTDSRATAYALQGLVNSASAEVFIDQRTNDRAQIDYSGKPYTVLNTALVGGSTSLRGVRTLFNRYHPSVQKMFIYDPAKDWTFYLAFMAGAQQNGIPVTDTVRAALQAQVPGWAGTVVDYRNIGTNRIEGYDWALANLMPNCTKKSVYFAKDIDLVCMDYVAASKSFVFDLLASDPAQAAKISEIFATPGYGVGTSLGGYAGDSVNQLANPYGIGYNVSNFYSNGSFWSSFPNKTYTQRAGQAVTAQNGKVYVAILLSDGDNLQFDQGEIYSIWKNDPARGTVPVGTSLSPVLQEINTPLLDWYYTNKTANDELMAGPCGVQFIYLDDYDPALLPQWCEINARWTADAGFSTASVWKGTYPSANYDVYTAMSGVDNIRHNANLFSLSSNPQYTNGVMIFNERIRDCQNPQELYDDLAGVATNASAPRFATGKLITPRFGGTNFSAVKSVIDQLNANFPGKYVFQLPMDQAATALEYFQPNRTWNTGNGTWDTSTANWLNSASGPATFANNVNGVVFADAGGVTGNPTITLNSTVTPVNVKMKSTSHNYTLSGSGGIGGNASLILDPANAMTLTLSSANTYTGDTTVNSGILALGAGGRLGNGNYAGDIRIAGGAILNIQTTSSQTLSGAITGGGTLSQNGGSDLILTGSATNTINNLSITGGRVFINNANAITASTTTTIGTNGILNIGGNNPTTIGPITVQNNGGIATRATAGTTLANVTLPDPGTAIFNNDDARTYPLTLSSSQTLSGDLTVQIGGGRNTANAVGGVTLSGILSGSGGLIVKANKNTLTLSGANSYAADTTITSGTLQLGASNVIPDGAGNGNVAVNGRLDLNTFSETINGLSGTGIVDTVAGGTPILTVGGNNQASTFSGVITNTAGTLSLTKIGSGTLILSGANSHAGSTTVSAGTLRLENTSAVSGSSVVAVGANTLQLATDTAFSAFPKLSSQGGTIVSDRATPGAGLTHVLGDATIGNGATSFTAGSNVTSGTAAIQLGNISNNNGSVASPRLNPTTANLIITGGVTLGTGNAGTANLFLDGAGSVNSIAGAIVNGTRVTGNVTKAGSSTWILSGVNTYNGATTVNGGTLLVNNTSGSGTGSGAVTVNTNGTLGGTGTIAGNVAVNSGGTLAPGTSIGKLTFDGNLTLNASSTNIFEVNGSTPTNDVVALGGTVTYGGVLKIVPTGTVTNGQTFTLFSGAGATDPSNFTSITSSTGATFSFTNGVLSVVTTVPSDSATLTNSVSGGVLSLAWPAGQGWRLEYQTNALTVGLGTNWVEAANSSVSSTNITIDSTKPTVFYRLVWP